jgi:hypothetical protein
MRLSLLLALLVSLATAPAAQAKTVDVPRLLRSSIPKARGGGVPVLLPARMNLDYSGRTYAGGGGGNDEYALFLDARPHCGGNACFLASFTAKEGDPLGFKVNVTLARGIKGAYKPLSCGASCSPPSIMWIQGGVRYEIQAKALGGRKAFVRMANSAIRHGRR